MELDDTMIRPLRAQLLYGVLTEYIAEDLTKLQVSRKLYVPTILKFHVRYW